MPCRLAAVAFDAHDPARVAAFWGRVLGREPVEDAHGVLLTGPDTQVGLRFVPSGSTKAGQNRIHLHLTSTTPDDQQDVVRRALALGARHLDVGQRPEEGHVVLADPEGNALCVIEPGNAFLAGCGFLGEVACEGTRDVGVFWAAALGWPLVWDQQEETAVQSPEGGTKVAWGGPPVPERHGRNRQRLELALVGDPAGAGPAGAGAAGDALAAEVERLVGLGATRIGSVEDGAVELADPDGNELRLSPPR
ncbi:VOC family protein [Cellulomonas sp. NS3]|uniref:VOC family protein n=1 Tax=Cellulomonas sp. NS3 TaxID=2973977 RepID=UPI0021634831|nr:VOC family protein [Cellulomonas sp. NS3]